MSFNPGQPFQLLPEQYKEIFNHQLKEVANSSTDELLQIFQKMEMMLYELDQQRAMLATKRKAIHTILDEKINEISLSNQEKIRQADYKYERDTSLDRLRNPTEYAKSKKTAVNNLESAITNMIKMGLDRETATQLVMAQMAGKPVTKGDVDKKLDSKE